MSTSQLDMLTRLAQEARDQAGQSLAKERQTEQQASSQLAALTQYRAEYAERLQTAMREGIDPATMYNYQQFLASLDTALSRARQALLEQQQRVQQRQQTWQQEQRRLSSYDTLATRRQREEHQRLARHEQKSNDELVNGRIARQRHDGAH